MTNGVDSNLGLIEVGNEGRITSANAAIEVLTGYSNEELLGLPVEQLVPTRFRNKHSRHRKDYEKNPQSRVMSYGSNLRIVTKSGDELPVAISLHAMSDRSVTRCAITPIDDETPPDVRHHVAAVINKLRFIGGPDTSEQDVVKTALDVSTEIVPECISVFWKYEPATETCTVSFINGERLPETTPGAIENISPDSQIGESLLALRDTIVGDYRDLNSASPPRSLAHLDLASGATFIVPGRYEPEGVVGIYFTGDPKPLHPANIEMYRQLADSLGYALSRQSVESELRRELEIQTVAGTIRELISTSNDLGQCFSEIAEVLSTVINIDRLVIAEYDEEKRTLLDTYVAGLKINEGEAIRTVVEPNSELDHLLSSTIPFIILDSTHSRDSMIESIEQDRLNSGLNSMLAINLKSMSRTVGILTIRSRSTNAYSDQDAAIAGRVSAILASAVTNTTLKRQIDEQLFVKNMLVNISSVASKNLDLSDLYVRLTEELSSFMSFERISISDFDDGEFVVRYESGTHVSDRVIGARYTADQLKESDSPTLWHVNSMVKTEISEIYTEVGLRSAFRVLIGDAAAPLALLQIHRESELGFSHSEQSLLTQVANQLAPSLANAFEHQNVVQLVERVAETDARYRELFDNAPDAIVSVDARTGKILDHNKMANDLFLYSSEELANMHVIDLYHRVDHERAQRIFKQFRDTGSVADAEAKFMRKDGSLLYVNINITGIRDAKGRMVRSISTIRDVSERIEADQVRKFAQQIDIENRELVQLNAMREEFLSRVSHELRTPLTALIAFTNILSKNRDANLSEQQLKQLELVSSNGWKLESLIEDLLDISRAEAGTFQIERKRFDLVKLVQSSIEEDRSIPVMKSQQLSLQINASPAWIDGDQKRISQVIDNLLTNASKYSPESSKIDVQLTTDKENVTLCVTDEGMGIGDSDLKHIFNPFFRANNALTQGQEGTGLGLAITKSIVELHGGHIAVDSDDGRGTSVEVTLPLAGRFIAGGVDPRLR